MENFIPAQEGQKPVGTTTAPAQTRSKQKRTPKSILSTVLPKAKRTFAIQLDKTNELKLRSLERFVGADAQDIERFWLHYRDQVELLLDSKRFERDCLSKGLIPEIVAEHLVFEGSGKVKRVIKFGLAVLGSEVDLYKESFTADKLQPTTKPVEVGNQTSRDEPTS